MKAFKQIGDWLTARYDKIVALAVFLGLVASLVYLAVRIGTISRQDAEFEREIASLKPAHPETEAVTSNDFVRAWTLFSHPRSVGDNWSNAISVPETRVWCPECKQPVPYAATNCPFCQSRIPDPVGPEGKDKDGDGIPDAKEQELGLDAKNPADAKEDADKDLFSNVAEFRAGTNLRDPKSHPEHEPFIGVEKIDPIPFKFRFKSYMKWKGDKRKFALNTRDDKQTYFAELGEKVEGFELKSFELKIVPAPNGIAGAMEDKSVLTLDKGGKQIMLTLGQDVAFVDHSAHVLFRLNDTRFVLRIGEPFELLPGLSYEVLRIDSAEKTVVLRRLPDGKEFTIGAFAEGANQ